MKIAVNRCFGGFDLSNLAIRRLLELKGKECYFYRQTKYSFQNGVSEYELTDGQEDEFSVHVSTQNLENLISEIPEDCYYYYGGIDRTDKDLIQTIEELQEQASGRLGDVEVVEIPDDVDWKIDDYDGVETIHEVHRSW